MLVKMYLWINVYIKDLECIVFTFKFYKTYIKKIIHEGGHLKPDLQDTCRGYFHLKLMCS